MIKKLPLLLLVFFFAGKKFSQQHAPFSTLVKNSKDKPVIDTASDREPHGIYFGLGPSYSGVDIYRYDQSPHRVGLNTRLYGEFSDAIRVVAEFTWIPKANYQSSWAKLGAFNTDLNANFMTTVGKDESGLVYGILGLCYHQWNGYFKQHPAFYADLIKYQPNSHVSKNWLGVNLGLGFELPLEHFDIFAEYRVRFIKAKFVPELADVAVNIGIKKRIFSGTHKKISLRKLFRGINDKYHWF